MGPAWMIQLLTGMVCLFAILVYLFYLRGKYQKKAVNHVLVTFIREENTSYKKLLPSVNGFVTLKGNQKKSKPEKDYPVGGEATWQGVYPEGWCPKFLQTPVRCMIFDEKCWEPLFNRGDPLLSPSLLRNIRREKFSQIGTEQAQEEVRGLKTVKGGATPSTLYIFLTVIIVAIAGLGIYMYVQWSGFGELLDKIRAALGV